jgi:hypothetical protein
MSKVDALRALREARHAQASAAPPAARTVTPKAATPKAAKASKATPAVSAPVEDGACGHRNMSGRSCTRPQGHAETSHRYTPKG